MDEEGTRYVSPQGSYPARNPFPHQGTLRLAGQRLDGSVPNVAGDFRTVPRRAILKLERFLSDFRSRFQPDWSGDGGAAFVRGRHGSGKTHTLFAAWKKFATDTGVFPVYVVAQDSEFLNLYRQFTGRLTLPLLVELGRGLLANMAVEELSVQPAPAIENPPSELPRLANGPPSSAEQKELRADLKAEPQRVKKLFATYTVEEGKAKARQRGTLADLTQGNSDLNRAVQCLQGDQFAADAADWFCMRPVAAEKLQAMGIARGIETAQQAAASMELLAALFTVANRPLVLFIDQCEKLCEGSQTVVLTSIGLMRSLMEAFESRNAALVISGTEEGWASLPEDARQRIGLSVVDTEFLTLEESLDLVRIYVIPIQEEFRPGVGSLFPFTEEAVREIVRLSAGNPRKLLQYCHVIFRRAQPGLSTIDLSMVNSTAKSELANQFFDKARVTQETRRILARQPYRMAEAQYLAGMRFDFALFDGQRAAVLVNVADAVYGDDEASNALLAADTVNRLRSAGELATFVLVVTGYVSPQVTEPLSRVVNELIVFAPEDFEPRLQKALEWARTHAPTQPREELSSEDRAALRDALTQIGTQRVMETRVVEKREEQVSDTHAQRRYTERRDTARREWSSRREKIEAAIASARKGRADADRASFDKERRRSNLLRWGLDFALAAGAGVLTFVASTMKYAPNINVNGSGADPRPLLVTFAIAAAAWVLWDVALIFLREDWLLKNLSDVELARLAVHRDLLLNLTWIHTPTVRFLKNIVRMRRSQSPRRIEELFKAERLAVLRLAYARALRDERVLGDPPPDILAEWAASTPEGALLAEDPKVADKLREARPPLDLLSALNGDSHQYFDRLAFELCATAVQDRPEPSSPVAAALVYGLDRMDLRELGRLTEKQIRTALRELSPLEANGLGTFDFLSKIADVDQAYLFCAQLLLYFEQDLLGEQATAARGESWG